MEIPLNNRQEFDSPPDTTPEDVPFDERMEQLFGRTLEHSEWGNLITWAPTAWLLTLANPNPLEHTNTAGADGLPDRQIDLEALFQGMLKDGMRDPLVLGIGLNGLTRLETGNQRIRIFAANNIEFVPVVGYVNETAVTHLENGAHKGEPLDTHAEMRGASYRQYVKLTNVLRNVPIFNPI